MPLLLPSGQDPDPPSGHRVIVAPVRWPMNMADGSSAATLSAFHDYSMGPPRLPYGTYTATRRAPPRLHRSSLKKVDKTN